MTDTPRLSSMALFSVTMEQSKHIPVILYPAVADYHQEYIKRKKRKKGFGRCMIWLFHAATEV